MMGKGKYIRARLVRSENEVIVAPHLKARRTGILPLDEHMEIEARRLMKKYKCDTSRILF